MITNFEQALKKKKKRKRVMGVGSAYELSPVITYHLELKGPDLYSPRPSRLQGDAGTLVYSIVAAGSTPGSVLEFFFINPTTGGLSVKKDLKQDRGSNVYTVSSRLFSAGVLVIVSDLSVLCETCMQFCLT